MGAEVSGTDLLIWSLSPRCHHLDSLLLRVWESLLSPLMKMKLEKEV